MVVEAKRLTGRRHQIAAGLAGMTSRKVARYRARWKADGFDLPPLHFVPVDKPPRSPRTRHRRRVADLPPVDAPAPPAFPFTGPPQITLLHHIWPTSRALVEWHAERLAQADAERRICGIATDPTTIPVDDVRAILGPGWEIFTARNKPKERELTTYRRMLEMIATTDPNAVTLVTQGKGGKAKAVVGAVEWWTEQMYQTVTLNRRGVLKAMAAGASVVGSFRRPGNMLRTAFRWHYSGAFYAFRNARVFDSPKPYRSMWFGIESWPGDYFPHSHSACLFGDDCGNLYKVEQQPR